MLELNAYVSKGLMCQGFSGPKPSLPELNAYMGGYLVGWGFSRPKVNL